ncbi:MAG: CPBP family intramembrane metalloprotease, partial [Gemmatimonadota bacterium]|nr:CPBP family intramembrane metalloprotease [Gemmatimonadota bacterium]
SALLLSPDGRLRAPWRILLFIVALFMAITVTITLEAFLDRAVHAGGYRPLVSEWGFALGALIATAALVFWVDSKSWDYVGLGARAAKPGLVARYALLGGAAIAIPSLLLMAMGQLRAVPAAPGSWWAATGLTFANLLPAAAGEELLLRGYIFAVLRESIGWRWTLIATSIVFGLFHVPNPGADAESVLLVMLAGFFLGAVLLATGSLYATIAVHFAWNWVMAAGLHTPVSGIPVLAPDYRVVDAGPDWLTGGGWGPEGGLGAAVSMFAIVIYIYARHLRRLEK